MFTLQFFEGVGCSIALFAVLIYIANRYYKKKTAQIDEESQKLLKERIAQAYQQGAQAMAKEMRKKLDMIQDQTLIRKCSLVVATSGDAELADGISRISIAGVRWENSDKNASVPVFLNFNRNEPIGLAIPFKQEGNLMAHIQSEGLAKYKHGYPAIGGIVEEMHEEQIDGRTIKVIDKFRLTEVSINGTPNADPLIKSVQDQLGIQK